MQFFLQASSGDQWMWTLSGYHSKAQDGEGKTSEGRVCGTGEKSTAVGQAQDQLFQAQVRERGGEREGGEERWLK